MSNVYEYEVNVELIYGCNDDDVTCIIRDDFDNEGYERNYSWKVPEALLSLPRHEIAREMLARHYMPLKNRSLIGKDST